MRRQKIVLYVGCILVLSLIAFIMIIFTNKDSDSDNITISNVKAVAYYGVSALAGPVDSHLVFIDEDGDVDHLKTENVEWGTVINTKDKIVMNGIKEIMNWDKQTEEMKQIASECEIYASYGYSSDYLEAKDIYYEIFNQGFQNPDSNLVDYRSTIRWGNEADHYCEDIPVYSIADGNDEEHVYVMTSEIDELGIPKNLEIIQYNMEDASLSDNRTFLREEGFEISHSRIVSEGDFLYVLYFQFADVNDVMGERQMRLLEINKEEMQITNDYVLHTYNYEEDPYYFPYNKDSLTIHDGVLYYSNGYGEIHTVDLETGEQKLQFSLPESEIGMYDNHKNIQINGNTIYYFYYDDDQEIHVLESYTLDGEMVDRLEISELMKELGEKGPEKFLFNFKVID
ncbi:hypothetical protein [Ornithinibacillus halotolerans]|uniref:DUF5050 domain-containing protein n=1 Tax=Ornithinibacillus halotolerans TaxID=1274357 RepID=A0A916W5C7_9BACI|nr:hypothetical protein [Ornithinibacillus halotolerans]GGA67630.1 hypothetical protein GCM10008025_09330 [Ornithinibacillus halotolerans]